MLGYARVNKAKGKILDSIEKLLLITQCVRWRYVQLVTFRGAVCNWDYQEKIKEIRMVILTSIKSSLPTIFSFVENVHQCEEHQGREDRGVSQRRHFVINNALNNSTLTFHQWQNTRQSIGWVSQTPHFNSNEKNRTFLIGSRSSFLVLQWEDNWHPLVLTRQ